MLGIHQGQVHKLAIEPGSPFSFYTCGEDGVVKHVSCCIYHIKILPLLFFFF